MESQDIRWHQRFNNYKKALGQLNNAVHYSQTSILNDLEKQGLIQAFEFTHELAWNVIKDFFYHQGNAEIRGSRDAVREAYKTGLIEDGEAWMEMIISRNKTSHTYDESTADEIVRNIIDTYTNAFNKLNLKLEELKMNE